MSLTTESVRPDGVCQGGGARRSSSFAVPLRVYRFFWYLRTEGVLPTVQRSLRHLRLRLGGPAQSAASTTEPEPPLNLQPGEWVEIKSEEEILRTLDGSGTNRGMQFMPQMRRYCGTRARVFKRLETVLFEESQKRRRIRSTVLL